MALLQTAPTDEFAQRLLKDAIWCKELLFGVAFTTKLLRGVQYPQTPIFDPTEFPAKNKTSNNF